MKKTFFLLIFLLPLIINPWGFDTFELSKLAYLIFFIIGTVLLTLGFFLKRQSLTIAWNKWVLIFLGLWGFSLLLSTIYSSAPLTSFWGRYERWQGLFTHIFYIAYFIFALQFFQKSEFQKKALKVIVSVAAIVSGIAIFEKFKVSIFSGPDVYRFLGRVFSTLGHPNFLGQFLIFPFIASLFLFWKEKIKSEKWKYGFAAGLMVIALFFTENRATFLGLIISAIIFVVFLKSFSRRVRIGAAVSGMLALILFIFLVAPSTRSIQSRLVLWKGLPALVSEQPIIGHGLETFKNVAQKTLSPEILRFEHLYDVPDRAHNEILDMLVMQGLFGVVIYLSALGAILWFVVKKAELLEQPESGAAFFGIIAFFISNLFSFSLIPHWIFLFTMAAFLLSKVCRWKQTVIRPTIFASFFAGILAVAFVMSSYTVTRHIIGDTHFKRGMDAYYKRNLMYSFEALGKGLRFHPNQDDLFFRAANAYFSVAEVSKDPLILSVASRYIESAGIFSNRNFRYFIELARVRTAEKKFEEAQALYQSAVKLAPVNPILWKEWAMSRYYTQDYQSTIEKMEKFLSLAPPNWQTDQNFVRLTPDFMDVFPPLSRSYAETGNREKMEYYLRFVKDKKTRENIHGFLKS